MKLFMYVFQNKFDINNKTEILLLKFLAVR